MSRSAVPPVSSSYTLNVLAGSIKSFKSATVPVPQNEYTRLSTGIGGKARTDKVAELDGVLHK